MSHNRQCTIEDVAREAQVAVGTVSRYLNGKPVRGGNQEKIAAAIEHLGFTVNMAARAMKMNQSLTIGLVLAGFDEFSMNIIAALTDKFREKGYALMTFHHREKPQNVTEILDFLLARQVDGILFSGGIPFPRQFDIIRAAGKPLVIFNNDIAEFPTDKVFSNDRSITTKAIEHFIAKGHSRIGFVTGSLDTSTGLNRYEGYRDALKIHDISEDQSLVYRGIWDSDAGSQAVATFLSQEDRPTAICFSNYRLAFDGIRVIKERGLKIPDDISLISFDDTEAFQILDPSITAIKQPVEEMAENMVRIILDKIKNPSDQIIQRIIVPCEIVHRGSVAQKT